ncbi:CatA-like O-acetyltransferase [Mycobacteroides abscessus]|uniref:CatA-like O-acetyltransferase n=1 Tax=Mycobacteroides abscessus TaxID=36809 RepID=UPI00092B8A26|nr:CatA-like O-acetyltransferase [Mycobacteroides abscessus]SIJ01397.1 Probable chloramphenicol acetyltransferase [Mycobacteroides abscessus subsp. bolletii]SLD75161.1 Probable chloramphenicol acetyltransferase [Mycobacteroides abscessus subsp. bolletii]SLD82356.1 Probable chloramphenicol acetyltransferase [Mycobacteroides abscessus subsp. bolletii]SPX72850.1 Probable chloramphenicol acetyltransferase [Mycobacteroides abscessus]
MPAEHALLVVMATFEPLDLQQWPRREWFEHYLDRCPTYYSMTVDLDITNLRAAVDVSGRKTYPTQIWALATVVNRHPEFRMALDDQGNPGVWDVVDPAFTVFNPDRETFAGISARYTPDFDTFHTEAAELLNEYRNASTLFPQGAPRPRNVFDISSIPWTRFTGFTLTIAPGWEHLAPIFTIGKFYEQEGRTMMPLALQIHHAAADGYHSARLVEELREIIANPDWARD